MAPLNWNTGVEMSSQPNDLWTFNFKYTPDMIGQTLEFKALLSDNQWMNGANAFVSLSDKNNTKITAYPFFYSTQGQYQYIHNVFSPQLNNYRDLVIYTPPSYYENPYKVIQNVLVMHDGQNLFNVSTSFLGNSWLCQNTVDALVMEGNMDEIIIVGVDNTPDRIDELTYSYDSTVPGGGKGDLYLDFIETTVLPIIEKNFRVHTRVRNDLGILGSSLGGLISCYAVWTRSKVYSKGGCMSSSFWWNNEDFNNQILVNHPVPNSDVKIYIDSGDSGNDNDDEAQTKRVRDHFLKLGFTLNDDLMYYLDHGGMHSETYWSKRFYIPMQFLYPPQALDSN
jgi:predicted alpha/beta superfamily hydrolase